MSTTYDQQMQQIEQKLNTFYEKKENKEKSIQEIKIKRADLLIRSTILAKKIKHVTKKYDSCAKRLESYLNVTLANALAKNKLSPQQLEQVREKALTSPSLYEEIENLRLLSLKYRKLSKKAKSYSKTLINLELELISLES